MIEFNYEIRVRYGEVDQMGFLYHAHYVTYFDAARTEMIRHLGVSNLEIEQEGIMIPVINVNINYGKPVHYDDVITIRTMIKERPRAIAKFHYEVYRSEELLTTGSVTVAFMSSDTKKACRPPAKLYKIVTDLLDKK